MSVLLVLAGPSGAGKGSIVRALRERDPALWVSVSATTRPPRPGERDGEAYHFLDRDQFVARRDRGGFLEWFEVFGEFKGTPRAPVESHLAAGDDVILEIDVQGAREIKRLFPDALLVFVAAPSRDEQRSRILARGGDAPEQVARRLAEADAEEAQADAFDAVVVNDRLEQAVDRVAAILEARRRGAVPDPFRGPGADPRSGL